MELEQQNNGNGFVMLDYKDALMRWSKSWAELAGDSIVSGIDSLKLEDLESDAGYASEGSYRRFYLGSKSCSVGSLEDCTFDEHDEDELFRRQHDHDDVYDSEYDVDDAEDDGHDAGNDADDAPEDTEGEGLDVNIEMIGSECVLVNGYKADDIPCPTEATRDGMTPEVNVIYDYEELIDLACKYLAHMAGRNECNIRPKICWAMKYAPEYEDESDS